MRPFHACRTAWQCRRRQQVKLLLELLSVGVTWAEVLFGNCLWRLCVLTSAHRLLSACVALQQCPCMCMCVWHVCGVFVCLVAGHVRLSFWFFHWRFQKSPCYLQLPVIRFATNRKPLHISTRNRICALHKHVKWCAHKLRFFKGFNVRCAPRRESSLHVDEQKAIKSVKNGIRRQEKIAWKRTNTSFAVNEKVKSAAKEDK